MAAINFGSLCLQIITFPFWFFFITLPNFFDDLLFRFQNRRFRLTRPRCVFLTNPSSGKKLGPKIFAIAERLNRGRIAFDVLRDDYVGAVRAMLLGSADALYVLVCGGDGTVNSVIDRFEGAFEESLRERLVYVPMGLGTGNDMSLSLNLGGKVNPNFINHFFRRVDSPRSTVKLIDRWQCRVFAENTQSTALDRSFLLYLGIGYDAEAAALFEKLRHRVPWMFRINKINKLYYGLLFIYLSTRDLFRGGVRSRLGNSLLYTRRGTVELGSYGDLIVLNSHSRASGVMHEWERGRGTDWAPQRMSG